MPLPRSGMNTKFSFGEEDLTVAMTRDLARGQIQGSLSKATRQKVLRSKEQLARLATGDKPVYGVNTGFGPLCTKKISPEEIRLLQENILRSHSVGVGEMIDPELVRMMLVIKLHTLALGHSGIAGETLDRMQLFLDKGWTALVPSQGSVGASGDLAPLAHLFLPFIGLGEVMVDGQRMPTAELYQKEGLKPLALGPKEGLALINGTQFISAHAATGVALLHNCLENADLIGAMSLEAMMGTAAPFHSELHRLRPFAGCRHVASRLRHLLEGSEIMRSHRNCGRVQDPYSLRCMPQVHGASRETWQHLRRLTEIELNSVTDNPVLLGDGSTVSGGNFHGQPLAMVLDYATLAASELGNISDRRVYLLLDGNSEGLPVLLLREVGVNSGFMLPQYTSAALASENKTLCYPASADSIPTSLGQEDHVSMGSISGRKFLQVLRNVENILSVELLCAAQAFDFRRPLKSSSILEACHARVREVIDHATRDRIFGEDIQAAHQLVAGGELVQIANRVMRDNNRLPDEPHDMPFRFP